MSTTLWSTGKLGAFLLSPAGMISIAIFLACLYLLLISWRNRQQLLLQPQQHQLLSSQLSQLQQQITVLDAQRGQLQQLLEGQQKNQQQQRDHLAEQQLNSQHLLQKTAQDGLRTLSEQIQATLQQHNQHSSEKIQQLTQSTQQRLQEIGKRVDEQLASGFEKTTATFSDVMRRLAIIDSAQQKITELSSNVVSLQEVLTDKRARGAFGEVQLASLIGQVLPSAHYSLQASLSNGRRVDCLLHLPQPTGNIAVDSKFPLENYRRMHDPSLAATERQQASVQFKQDIKKHIKDIASKYIIKSETSDGAIMFVPAEAVFAEIHASCHEIVELAQQSHVWITSPTTMHAILTTMRAVVKDAATREQVHIIQQHLNKLGTDFSRFQKRMDNLARHIDLAQKDVSEVHQSSNKISSRFSKIESVQLQQQPTPIKEDDMQETLLDTKNLDGEKEASPED